MSQTVPTAVIGGVPGLNAPPTVALIVTGFPEHTAAGVAVSVTGSAAAVSVAAVTGPSGWRCASVSAATGGRG